MIDTSKMIYEKLSTDSELLSYLGANKPYANKNGASAKANSIYPAGLAPMTAVTPFVTVQGGVINKISTHTISESFYIRVYNKKELSYYDINKIGERIIEIFDEQIFSLDNRVMIRGKYDSSLQEATDEAMQLNFRELRFRIVLI